MRRVLTWWSAHWPGLAGSLAVLAFAVLVGRFWHPYYGFTSFLQIDESDAAVGLSELRARPVYFYPGNNGYDGSAYAQIAFHPLLDSSELRTAIGNVPYRARRILGSALAWALAGGNPTRIAHIYAGLNVGVWLAFAGILWWLLPVRDGRSWMAWAGLLFSAGALHAVRLALTDLLAVTLFAAAMLMAERGGSRSALGFLAAAGLARETALAGVVAWWRGPWNSWRAWIPNALRGAAVAAPLAAWMVYVRWKAGPEDQGFGNFTWPVAGWAEKWFQTLADFRLYPAFAWLNVTTLLATIGLSAQAAYLACHRRMENPWWRAGAVGVVMMMFLGTSVWEGHPGAATRVLLPMGLAFAVLVVRERAAWPWLLLGNLSICSGVLALWHPPQDPRELGAGRFDHGAYIVRLEAGWYDCENHAGDAWAWSAGRGELGIETWSRGDGQLRVKFAMRTLTERRVEIRQDAKVLWSGAVGTKLQWIEFGVPNAGGARLQFLTDAAPVRENNNPGARDLGFAIYNPQIE